MQQYIVDAFTDQVFSGNPAAVCVMENWLDDELMQSITNENNLSETAFAVKKDEGHYHLRWFTPGGEIDLCGHATLATAFVIMNFYEKKLSQVSFETLSGDLIVQRQDDIYEMTFPAYDLKAVEVTDQMTQAFGAKPIQAFLGRDLLCVFDDEDLVRQMNPDMDKLKVLDGLLQHATAQGRDFDTVSRSFAPKLAVAEDPVCGSGHCHIVPYWAEVLEKTDLVAFQASKRTGILYCKLERDKIKLSGKAVLYAQSQLFV